MINPELCAHPDDGPYARGLDKNPANFAPLTPIGFLDRSAEIYPNRTAVIHGSDKTSYEQLRQRCRQLASALQIRGIAPGDTVAVMAPNTPPMLEAHYGVPMAGAVLNALNVRLDAATIAYILQHGEARLLIVDLEYVSTIRKAMQQVERSIEIIEINDPFYEGPKETLGGDDYETFLQSGNAKSRPNYPADEWQAIALNYTSGTTGEPKGVVYHHRGAYLNAIGNSLVWQMPHFPVYLWTLPMFHCNGWCFPWTVCLQAGTHVCLRHVNAASIYRAIADHGVTHLCGAPIVMGMLVNADEHEKRTFSQPVSMMTAASAPPAAIVEQMQALGITITHVYGLTEVYGPATVCAYHPEWDDMPIHQLTERLIRQGVRYPVLEGLDVLDPESMQPVPRDGQTIGEIMMRGHDVMKGYLKNSEATEKAFSGGWFHTGDLAVMHEDGYVEIKDRSKDIIISGGENISSIEIEGALYRHPDVAQAAVVARPDTKWGETPCAFVELKAGSLIGADELIAHCRNELAAFKVPKTIIFGALPTTSTGKIQKFQLRERARELSCE